MTIWRLNPRLPVTGQAAWLFEGVPNSVQIQTLKLDLHPPRTACTRSGRQMIPLAPKSTGRLQQKNSQQRYCHGNRSKEGANWLNWALETRHTGFTGAIWGKNPVSMVDFPHRAVFFPLTKRKGFWRAETNWLAPQLPVCSEAVSQPSTYWIYSNTIQTNTRSCGTGVALCPFYKHTPKNNIVATGGQNQYECWRPWFVKWIPRPTPL